MKLDHQQTVEREKGECVINHKSIPIVIVKITTVKIIEYDELLVTR